MRAQESNSFDVLVVAGDIGSDCTHQIFDVLTTFKCPVLYVYGNWDHKLSYDASFGDVCHHLHLSPFESGPITFAGFSGCTAGWGQNPEAQRLHEEVNVAHSEIIRSLDSAKNEEKRAASLIEDEYTASVDALTTTSRRSLSQRKLKALDADRQRKLAALSKIAEDIRGADAYGLYLGQLSSVSEEVLTRNRRSLSEMLRQVETPRERTVVVTHDRLAKTQTDFAGVPVFLFGHRHGFAETNYQGAKYINVSALDLRRTVRPKVFSRGDHWKQFRNINFGNYAVLEWDQSAGFNVTRIPLDLDLDWQEHWELETVIHMPNAPFLS
ncbi:Calcineurin-like phosphoesterase domain family protein [Rhizobium leguminosarum]|uniref:Calcineurin-like phosphoesterase domain family protein n=2 Tax=Rhizobium leguminosarum TaxID=384 RepID=A0A2Z4YFR1_RHILE|nr:Calcineurin-like phosphoesterase domain family protein [Rhizobium leguminosarum]